MLRVLPTQLNRWAIRLVAKTRRRKVMGIKTQYLQALGIKTKEIHKAQYRTKPIIFGGKIRRRSTMISSFEMIF